MLCYAILVLCETAAAVPTVPAATSAWSSGGGPGYRGIAWANTPLYPPPLGIGLSPPVLVF